MDAPKFSAFPWARLPRRSRREAAIESVFARWIAGRARVIGAGAAAIDPHGAACELRSAGEVIVVHGSAALVRAYAQHVLGGPAELAAPRPLGVVERALWAQAVSELGLGGDVRPLLRAPEPAGISIELAVALAGARGTAVAVVPDSLALRAPPQRELPAWAARFALDAPIVVARCALARDDVARLAVRDLVTVERGLALEIFAGDLALRAAPNAVVAEVASEYVRRAMALPDDASIELAVTLGTTRLSLRQVLGLGVGEIVALGRPLGGPFEVRAEGRIIGEGELVDVDGELAVRIVSLQQKAE
ncbi:MAG TPA: FliM/FliN family flagellar motor switch protein [Kofleriaceae bacterium]|jgi:flagellar motor switch/type III secretory pathway protein FliN